MTASLAHKAHKMSIDEVIVARHSTRRFLSDKPVPKDVIQRALQLATHAPSNSNIQPWRLYLLSGAAADRLKRALVAEVNSGAISQVPPLPEAFKHFNSEVGKQLYGADGLNIPRDDVQGHQAAVLRNYEFYGAPTTAIVCIDNALTKADALSVGMYLQTFLLALTEAGLGSCVEISVSGYPEIIRKTVGIPAELDIICGVAIGYEDETMKVNKLRMERVAVEETTVILEDNV